MVQISYEPNSTMECRGGFSLRKHHKSTYFATTIRIKKHQHQETNSGADEHDRLGNVNPLGYLLIKSVDEEAWPRKQKKNIQINNKQAKSWRVKSGWSTKMTGHPPKKTIYTTEYGFKICNFQLAPVIALYISTPPLWASWRKRFQAAPVRACSGMFPTGVLDSSQLEVNEVLHSYIIYL